MRDPVTAQKVHSEVPRPQPREAKTVAVGTGDGDTGDISDEFDTVVKRKLLVVRKSIRLVVLHDENGHWIKERG